jgi:formate-dependent nitrite reductase membrane component NrfD
MFLMLLSVSIALQLMFNSRLLYVISMLSATGYMLSQAFIISSSDAISTWRKPDIPFFFMSSGLASGWGFFVITKTIMNIQINSMMTYLGIGLIILNALIWISFIRREDSDIEDVMRILKKPLPVIFSIGIGHVIPITLIMLVFSKKLWLEHNHIINLIASSAVIAGIFFQKRSIVTSAGYFDSVFVSIPNERKDN